ncbi:acyl-CoA dehydrogenase family protein, partial [Sphingorhabdus sp.]|uniref:acyl-CoA dehydrogenase family protein n=1 Tax=Sphingorhabdus sp. TaxID=1902408 RepID=UPI0037C8853E
MPIAAFQRPRRPCWNGHAQQANPFNRTIKFLLDLHPGSLPIGQVPLDGVVFMSLDVIPRSAYNEDHEAFRQTVRQFLLKEVSPNADKWADDGIVP